MNKSLIFRNKIFNFLFLLISFFIFFYIMYYTIASDRGVIKYFKLSNEFNKKNDQYIHIINSNNELRNKIDKLNPNNIDIDFLEEISRKKIGYLSKNEIIIVF